jgi:hypothetical protein
MKLLLASACTGLLVIARCLAGAESPSFGRVLIAKLMAVA